MITNPPHKTALLSVPLIKVATPIDQTVQNSEEHHYPPILLTKRLGRMLYTPWLKLTLPLATSAIIIANFANSYATLEL